MGIELTAWLVHLILVGLDKPWYKAAFKEQPVRIKLTSNDL